MPRATWFPLSEIGRRPQGAASPRRAGEATLVESEPQKDWGICGTVRQSEWPGETAMKTGPSPQFLPEAIEDPPSSVSPIHANDCSERAIAY